MNGKERLHVDNVCDCPASAVVIGAGRGLGLAFARELLRAGVGQVHAASREPGNRSGLQALAQEFPSRLIRHRVDVTNETELALAAASVERHASEIQLLVNCAGVLHGDWGGGRLFPERKLADVNADALMHCFAVNGLGALLAAKHFSRLFPRRSRVVLANVSARVGSISDNRLGGWYGYRASKAAQNMFTRNLAIELKRRCRALICVALHPGTVATRLSEPFLANVPPAQLSSPECAAQRMLGVIERLRDEDNGAFLTWTGERLAW